MLPLKGEGELEWSQQGYQSSLKTASSVGRVKTLSVQFSHSVVSDSLQPHGPHTPGLPVYHQLPKFTQTHVR